MSEQSKGWPFPDRPGVPLNPKDSGLHYIMNAVAFWNANTGKWSLIGRTRPEKPECLMRQYWAEYRGPCLTSEEVTKIEINAEARGKEAGYHNGYDEGCAVNALSTSVLYQSGVDEGRIAEREKIASQVDCGCDIRDAVLDRLDEQGERKASWLCSRGDSCSALVAAIIRNGGKETKND